MIRYLPFILILALTIFAFIDCLNTPEDEIRHLPKVIWVIIILLFSIVGPIVWFVAGKRKHSSDDGGGTAGTGRARVRRREWIAPDDNPDFLKSLDGGGREDEASFKEREADLRRREEELERRESEEGPEGNPPPKS